MSYYSNEYYDTIITPYEAADMLNMGMNNLYKLLRSGKLKSVKNGRVYQIPKRAVQEYIIQESHLSPYGWH